MKLPAEQEAIRAKCFHRSGIFVEFPQKDVETSIPERFQKIVQTHPNHLAVKTQQEELTYAQLDSAANRVAHALTEHARRDGKPIALLFAKGAQGLAAMLGVLKSGQFMVLLDASFAKEQLETVLAKSKASLLLADAENLPTAREIAGTGATVIDYETVRHHENSSDCNPSLAAQRISYIVYTSGSTGAPKGVLSSHQTLLHHVRVLTNAYHVCKEDRVCLLTSLSGGAFATMALALLNGATLYLNDFQRSGVRELSDWLRREHISICFIPSPLFRNMATTVKVDEPLRDLRLIRLRSDKVHATDIALCKTFLPSDCVIATGLATTETGTIRLNLLERDAEIVGEEVPVGFAVDDKEVFLLNDDGQEAGLNQVGEIAVRSKYLSPGYWNSPELTSAKFKRAPEDGEMRIYYTGDLGLMLPDGCLIHKGRKDFRTKIRGYAVDCLEVEKALLSYSGVKEAVVSTQTTGSGDARLIAYFVSADAIAPTTSDLREYLKNKLAGYMIPSVFVTLDAIPLTTNGKVNRKALPLPQDQRPQLRTAYSKPRNETETNVVNIWEKILGVRPIGVYDNFFDLGGHSLAATRVVAGIFEHFLLEIPLRLLFESPTAAEMAAVIKEHGGRKLDADQLSIILDELESLSEADAQRLVDSRS